MDNMLNSNKTRKRLSRTLIISAAILFSLISFVLSPLYTYTCSDVLYAVTALPEIIEIVIDITEVVAYAVCFATIIYSIFKFSLGSSVKLMVTYCAAVFLKYTANLIISFIWDGAVSTPDFVYVFVYFALDAVILLTIVAFSSSFIRKYHEKRTVTKKSNNTLGKATPSIQEELFDGKKIFILSNPLHRSALAAGIVLSAIKIVTRILFDISLGAPTSVSDTLWMITYYVSDILIAIIVYAISVYMFTHFNAKEQEDEKLK